MLLSASVPMTRASGLRTDSSLAPEPLLEWFAEQGRDLPWRRTRDPWAILVSELMLQQTQVARVIERWPRFLERFPTATACAERPVGDVIDEWSGLGYNRRAVNLHRTATLVRDLHGGVVPTSLANLLSLPGIGPYTARAVRAFAFELDDGVVDTNIGRVLARIGGRQLKPAAAQRLADDLVPRCHGWEWNQAIMELGALVCRATPVCEVCPVIESCLWRGGALGPSGIDQPDPAKGSASVSKGQSRFEGSDRQGRGRLIVALRSGPVTSSTLASVMGWPDDNARGKRVAATLLADGLAVLGDSGWELP